MMNMRTIATKKIEGYLILDWKTGAIRISKRKPKNLKGNEIPMRLDITVNLPDYNEPTIKGEIKVSEIQAHGIVEEEI